MDCDCGKKFVGETSLKVSTRLEQHKDPGPKMGTHWYFGPCPKLPRRAQMDRCRVSQSLEKKIRPYSTRSIGDPVSGI